MNDNEKLEAMNEKHVFLFRNGKAEILNIHIKGTKKTYSFSPARDLELRYANDEIIFNGHKESLGKAWMKWPGRLTMNNVDFHPNGTDDDTFNLWQGFGVSPKAGSCDLYLDHIYKIVASGDASMAKYILDYMAHAGQKPEEKPGVALVLRGEQGTGKGTFVHYFLEIFDPHVAQITNGDQIFGRFNAILSHKMIVFLDEGLWSGDKQREGNLKALITEDRITIEQKGHDPFNQRNFIRLIVATNSDWSFPVARKERRGCIIDVSSDRIGDSAYFHAIRDQMDNGGTEALLDMLLKRDISGVNIRDYPKTDAYRDQMEHTFDAFDSWYHDCLNKGVLVDYEFDGMITQRDWTSPFPISHLFDAFEKHAKRRGIKFHLSESQFGKRMLKYAPGLDKQKLGKAGNRVNNYVFPPLLECRKGFENIFGTVFEWDI